MKRSALTRVLIMGLAVVACLSTALRAQAAPLSTNLNFDTDTVGLPPAGWIVYTQNAAGSTVMVTSAQSTTAPNSLELRTGSTYTYGADIGQVKGLGAFNANIMGYFTTNQIQFSIRLTANSDQQFRWVMVDQYGNNSFSHFQILFRNGGVFAQYGTVAGGLIETNLVSSFSADTWYDVRVLNRPVDTTISIRVYAHGGPLLATVDNLINDESATPDGFDFINDGRISGVTAQSVFIDSLSVQNWVPFPAGTSVKLQ